MNSERALVSFLWISNISFKVATSWEFAFRSWSSLSCSTCVSCDVQVPDVLSHGGLDAAPGEVRLKDVDLIISFPGAQKLPADRDQERRALSAAGRKDVADSRTLLSRRAMDKEARTPISPQAIKCRGAIIQSSEC